MQPKNPEIPKPDHIAVIMDGNGRWAKKRGLPRIAGHRRGVDTVREMVKACGDRGISHLTLFAFSSENWRRPRTEVDLLIDLLVSTLENEIRKLHENGVNLKIIGDVERFGSRIKLLIKNAEQLTSANNSLTLTIAMNYGGRWDLLQAMQQIAQKVADKEINVEQIDESLVDRYLSTAGIPEPDLFIRTGGETRVSNFLLWQLAYTELYFTEVLWPDFNEHELDRALLAFAGRQRRFGQTGEQVSVGR
ncbi:MAG: isoprenyl transferase [marine bacterium B5-7]|nr:MAG: isoprenyl transferase [marine bacterium B5-7]